MKSDNGKNNNKGVRYSITLNVRDDHIKIEHLHCKFAIRSIVFSLI